MEARLKRVCKEIEIEMKRRGIEVEVMYVHGDIVTILVKKR